MKVSVVIPVYNEATRLREAVASVLRQNFADYEILLIDDGSTDETYQVMTELSNASSQLRIWKRPHGGIVAALNFGLTQARGAYIARMDADDLCLPGRLQKQVACLDAQPEIGLVSGLVTYGGDVAQYAGLAAYVAWVNGLRTPKSIYQHRFVESPIIHPSVMFRRTCVEKHGAYEAGPFPEDYQMWLRWLAAGVRMTKINESVLEWREREDRLTRTDSRLTTEAFYRCKSLYLAHWLRQKGHDLVVVWGCGKMARKRVRYLTEHGIRIKAYVDVDPKKIGKSFDGIEVHDLDYLNQGSWRFLLSYVGNRGVRDEIEQYLKHRGRDMGKDYLLVA